MASFCYAGRTLPALCGIAALCGPARAQETDSAPLPRQPVQSAPANAADSAPPRFTFQNTASARTILTTLLDKVKASYVVGPGVSGEISVRFVDVPLDTILARIAASVSPPLVITRATDGAYLINGGETGPTRLSLATPPTTVTLNQPQPPTSPPISVAVTGGDPVAVSASVAKGIAKTTQATGKTVRTASGLQYKVLKAGTGAAPKKGQYVRVHYTGVLEDGTKFDSSRNRGAPFEFALGQGQVIQGWDEGVALMKVGERGTFIMPAKLAYGATPPPGAPIPPNAVLLFDIELLGVSNTPTQ